MAQTDHVITFGPPKEAALYFEQVLPLDFSMAWFGALGIKDDEPGIIADARDLGVPFDGKTFDEVVVRSLLPHVNDPLKIYANQLAVTSAIPITILLNVLLDKSEIRRLVARDDNNALLLMFEMAGLDGVKTLEDMRSGKFKINDISSKVFPRIRWFLEKSGFLGAPSWLAVSGIEELRGVRSTKMDRIEYAIALKNLNLVDIRKVSWDAVIEFRKDAKSLSALRRFRMFFTENYEGKGETFIRDKIGVLLEDYESTAKLWGFETARKTLSVAVSRQNVVKSSVGTFAPALAGMSLPVAASVGAAITLGSCAVEFSKVFVDQRREFARSPLNYLTRLKSLK